MVTLLCNWFIIREINNNSISIQLHMWPVSHGTWTNFANHTSIKHEKCFLEVWAQLIEELARQEFQLFIYRQTDIISIYLKLIQMILNSCNYQDNSYLSFHPSSTEMEASLKWNYSLEECWHIVQSGKWYMIHDSLYMPRVMENYLK